MPNAKQPAGKSAAKSSDKTSGKNAAPKTRRAKKPPAPAASRGLAANRLASAAAPATVERLREAIEADGGAVLGSYRDPLGGNWQLLAALPIELVEPTPYQRDLSLPHVERLAEAIDKLDRFLDPVIVVRVPEGKYWTPNGHHRLAAMRSLGARSITALVVSEIEVAHRILILNTEKAHNLRERAAEVTRLAQGLAEIDPRPEREYATEFEEPALLTLGLCYQKNGRFAGSVYHPVLKRLEKFSGARLPAALAARAERAEKLLALDQAVNEAVARLKERGLESPYLKAFVVARINPLRFKRGQADFDETIEKMTASAARLDPAKVRTDQIAQAGGPAEG
ncbi:MAG: ParB N-terminal domain-containing protein [Candidatus Eisenbacteria bacterium]|nr:ParB N-terminal domain-containing protein [Candidatus Eisenbacteria bacterium]